MAMPNITPSVLRHRNGTQPKDANAGAGPWAELGTLGLDAVGGYVFAAYHAELRWPGCYPLFNRIRRSDSEIAVVRQIFSAIAAGVELKWEGAEQPNDDDKRALEFAQSVWADLEGGIEDLRDNLVAYVPFMGWGWWEAVPGLRRAAWQPPGDDPWRSQFDDGLVGFRRFAWRDHSSFQSWALDERLGRLRGLVQVDAPNPPVTIPLNRSLHVTFGDSNNPEGLPTLEAIWRLERLKYGLEVVQGIGFEHAAGYLSVAFENDQVTATDKAHVRDAARSIMSAQEGNYATWPKGITGQIEDVPFQAATALQEAIRYYGLLKLAVFNMQWVALSTISGTGSFAAMKDSSSMWLVFFNAMMQGFARQIDDQIGKRLFAFPQNRAAFPQLTQRPRIVATPVEKFIELADLGQFLQTLSGLMPLGAEDWLAIRRKSGFLPETLPDTGGAGDGPPQPKRAPVTAEMERRGAEFDAALAEFRDAMK